VNKISRVLQNLQKVFVKMVDLIINRNYFIKTRDSIDYLRGERIVDILAKFFE